jgi:hypothetical protein
MNKKLLLKSVVVVGLGVVVCATPVLIQLDIEQQVYEVSVGMRKEMVDSILGQPSGLGEIVDEAWVAEYVQSNPCLVGSHQSYESGYVYGVGPFYGLYLVLYDESNELVCLTYWSSNALNNRSKPKEKAASTTTAPAQ